MQRKWTEADLVRLVQERFRAPEFAFLPQVRNGTGYARSPRTADAIAMGLWPSRGLHLHGFEVKVARSDWLREKDAPEKAEEIARFCHCWWLVVSDADIVQPGELPPTWGLLAPKGKKLAVIQQAPVREAQPPTHLFLAAVLRRAAEAAADRIDPAEVEAEVAKRVERDKAAWLAEEQLVRKRFERAHQQLLEQVNRFEAAAGIQIGGWQAGRIGEAVRLILAGEDIEQRRRRLEAHATDYERLAQEIRQTIGGSQ